jgi:parallel beta-helix repeat protein
MSTTIDSVASGNTIYNATLTGIELASATGCTVSANTIDGNSSTDQGISASNTTPSRNVITGNKIKGCTSAGIQINAGDYTVITGNYVDQATGYALNILATKRFTITGNVGVAVGDGAVQDCTPGSGGPHPGSRDRLVRTIPVNRDSIDHRAVSERQEVVVDSGLQLQGCRPGTSESDTRRNGEDSRRVCAWRNAHCPR